MNYFSNTHMGYQSQFFELKKRINFEISTFLFVVNPPPEKALAKFYFSPKSRPSEHNSAQKQRPK